MRKCSNHSNTWLQRFNVTNVSKQLSDSVGQQAVLKRNTYATVMLQLVVKFHGLISEQKHYYTGKICKKGAVND